MQESAGEARPNWAQAPCPPPSPPGAPRTKKGTLPRRRRETTAKAGRGRGPSVLLQPLQSPERDSASRACLNLFSILLLFFCTGHAMRSGQPARRRVAALSFLCPELPFPAKFRPADAVEKGCTRHWQRCIIRLGRCKTVGPWALGPRARRRRSVAPDANPRVYYVLRAQCCRSGSRGAGLSAFCQIMAVTRHPSPGMSCFARAKRGEGNGQ
jgi:hypothetical protein